MHVRSASPLTFNDTYLQPINVCMRSTGHVSLLVSVCMELPVSAVNVDTPRQGCALSGHNTITKYLDAPYYNAFDVVLSGPPSKQAKARARVLGGCNGTLV